MLTDDMILLLQTCDALTFTQPYQDKGILLIEQPRMSHFHVDFGNMDAKGITILATSVRNLSFLQSELLM